MNNFFQTVANRRDASVLLILFAVAAINGNGIDNAFQYDDLHSIVENPHIRNLGNIPEFFTRPEFFSRDPDKGMFRPMVLISLALNYALSGYDVYSYHLLNIALHALCALCVWGILRRLGRSPCVALLGGLFFALHPLCSEPVNYISSRSELLAVSGLLGSVWTYLAFVRNGKMVLYAASIACFAFALLGKSSAIVLPGLLLTLDLSRRIAIREIWKRYLPYALLSAGYLFLVRRFLSAAVLTRPVRSLDEQLGTQAKGLVYYGKLLLFPSGLSVDHAFEVSPLFSGTPLVCLIGVVSIASLSWLGRERFPAIFLGVAWIGIALAPTAIVPLNVLVNEHRLYLPLVGGCILLSGFDFRRIGGVRTAGGLLLVVMAVLTFQRNRVWQDGSTLWADAAQKGPGLVRPYIYLGNASRDAGDGEKALGFYEKALERDPGNIAARNNMANVLREVGRLEDAAALYREVLEEHPDMWEVHYNLGRIYQDQKEIERARESYSKIPESSVHFALVLNNLGTLREMSGQLDSALIYYRRALDRKPDLSDAVENMERLGRKLLSLAEEESRGGNPTAAERYCRLLLAHDGRHRQARFLLAVSLFQQARYSESIRENQRLVEEHPEFDEGRLQLANALESSGRWEEARREYEVLIARTENREIRQIAVYRLNNLLERNR